MVSVVLVVVHVGLADQSFPGHWMRPIEEMSFLYLSSRCFLRLFLGSSGRAGFLGVSMMAEHRRGLRTMGVLSTFSATVGDRFRHRFLLLTLGSAGLSAMLLVAPLELSADNLCGVSAYVTFCFSSARSIASVFASCNLQLHTFHGAQEQSRSAFVIAIFKRLMTRGFNVSLLRLCDVPLRPMEFRSMEKK